MDKQGEVEFSIKQVADLFGNTRGAIRFYQEKGLVEPRVNEKGFRFYSLDDLFQLMHLKSFAAMSFPVDDVSANLRLESGSSVEDVVALVEARMDDVRAAIARQRRQLDELAAFRDCLRDARSGEIRFTDAEEYWSLDAEQVARMMSDDPETLKRIVAQLPDVMIGSTYDLRSRDCAPNVGLRLRAEVARRAGVERDGRFAVLAAGPLAFRMVRLAGADLTRRLPEEVARLAEDVRAAGRRPGGEAFSRLVFVHEEDGERVEYHGLFISLEKDD